MYRIQAQVRSRVLSHEKVILTFTSQVHVSLRRASELLPNSNILVHILEVHEVAVRRL